MGDYHAVVPVDWERLTRDVLPAWCAVLREPRRLADFGSDYAPSTWASLDEHAAYWGEPVESSWRALGASPSDYLTEIGWTGSLPLDADQLRRSGIHAALQASGAADEGVELLMEAIRRRAAVEVAGAEPEGLDRHGGYYAALHEGLDGPVWPTVRVAGTKNRYRFTEALFDYHWHREDFVYRLSPRGGPSEVADWLADLLMSRRAFPGTAQTPYRLTWPGYSDERLPGYLLPNEVSRLNERLPDIATRPEVEADVLFPLFRDRVGRATDRGLGLVTFYSGL